MEARVCMHTCMHVFMYLMYSVHACVLVCILGLEFNKCGAVQIAVQIATKSQLKVNLGPRARKLLVKARSQNTISPPMPPPPSVKRGSSGPAQEGSTATYCTHITYLNTYTHACIHTQEKRRVGVHPRGPTDEGPPKAQVRFPMIDDICS